MKASSKVIAVSLTFLFLATLAVAQTNLYPHVQHVIIVIQENRTPTNLFHEDQNLVSSGAHVIPPNNQGPCGRIISNPPSGVHCNSIAASGNVTLTGIDYATGPGANHGHYPGFYCTYNSGNMNGACHNPPSGSNGTGCPNDEVELCPYTYLTNTPGACPGVNCNLGILTPDFQIAEQYGFANWMFSTHQGPSEPAHLFLFAGTSAPDKHDGDTGNFWQYWVAENDSGLGCLAGNGDSSHQIPPAPPQSPPWTSNPYTPPGGTPGYPCWGSNSLPNLLDPANVSWRYYDSADGLAFWNAPRELQQICQPGNGTLPGDVCQGNDYNTKVLIGNPGRVLQDLGAVQGQSCDLQAVTWVIPDGNWSDHPGTGSTNAGPSWVGSIVNAVNGFNNDGTGLPNQCKDPDGTPYWKDTVVIVTWDDFGGFYDDVLPWRCNNVGVCQGYPDQPQSADYVYGFRVPLLVVGAYVNQVTPQGGYISGTPGQGGEVQRYVHDFGSILNFIEYAFGTGGNPLGGQGGIAGTTDYPLADWLAPDGPNAGCNPQQCPYGLSDFFSFGHAPRNPVWIKGYLYNTGCFLNPTSCFANYPAEPDNDSTDE
jgi:Phosphoesterase family